jgi:hypothetical protein
MRCRSRPGRLILAEFAVSAHIGGTTTARFMVERTFPDGLEISMTEDGAKVCPGVVDRNGDLGVTWVHSYVSADKKTTNCVHDGPNPEAIRTAAERNSLPVDRITKVSVLDPYFYQ